MILSQEQLVLCTFPSPFGIDLNITVKYIRIIKFQIASKTTNDLYLNNTFTVKNSLFSSSISFIITFAHTLSCQWKSLGSRL